MRVTRPALLLLSATVAAGSGCRGNRESPPPPAGVAAGPRVPERPSVTYRPPRDGLLRKEQIETYLKVLETAARSAVPKLPLGPGHSPSTALVDEDPLVAPDVAAARAMKLNEEEFLWIRERVLEAEAATTTARLNADVLAMLERTLSDLRSRRTSATDQGSRQLIDEQISEFESERARVKLESSEPEPEQIRTNVKALEPFRARIAVEQAEIDRSRPLVRPQRRGTTPAPR